MEATENEILEVEEVVEEETPETELTPETDWEAEAKKARGIAQRALTKLKKLGEVKQEKVEPTPEPVKETQKTGGSDVEALLLEVKGIVEPEEIALFEKWKADTGRPARDILKGELFQKELQAIKTELEVKKATPSSSKRSGAGESNDLALALAKAEQTGQLPSDFALKSQVINAMVEKENTNKPAWH